MPRTLISFLGTTNYADTVYRWPRLGEHQTPHVVAALGKLWQATDAVILATQAAEDKNGPPLRESLAAAGLPEPVFKRLPDGRSEEELWTQFQVMRETIQEAIGDEVLIDITLGFRAQSFFAGGVLSVLQAAGLQPGSLTVVYGEYRKDEPASPIWDITLFIELIDWAQALGLFLRTGVDTPVVELGRRMQRREVDRVLASSSHDFPTFGRLVQEIERFADDLATIRVTSIITGYEQDHSMKLNARGSAARLVDAIEQCRKEVTAKLLPLALILDELVERVRPLSADRLYSENGERAQRALARHYLTLARYPEAAVVVREARVNLHAEDERAVEVNSPDFDNAQRRAADMRFGEQDPDIGEIGDIRNDIEHGGFRKQPLPAKVLQKRIEDLVQRFAPFASGEPKGTPGGAAPSSASRTYFVTRHAGAVEWAVRQGIAVDRTVEHLDPAEVRPGDMVLGTLPVHLVAEVCARGARYLHLVLELPLESRGLELTPEEMARCRARLVEYRVERIP